MNERKMAALQSIDELRDMGTVEALRLNVERIVTPLKVEASSYDELWKVIQALQTHWAPCMKGPFVSRRKELIYTLTRLEGKQRKEALGICSVHFEDPARAKALLRSLRQQLTDKTGEDFEAGAAFVILTDIFGDMEDVQEDTVEGEDGRG